MSDTPGGPPAPDLAQTLQQLGASGRAGLSAAGDAASALRALVAADLSLARSATGRALACAGIAIAFGASAWLLLMASLIAWMSIGMGMSWTLALLLTALFSVLVTAGAGYAAMRYFEHTRLKATRRQFARLGFGELANFMPDPDSPESSADAAERVAQANETGEPIKKGLGVDVTPP